jgi:ketosteroid isomerase-like protein
VNERPTDIVRRVYERWAQGDFSAGGELYDEASVFVLSPDFPDSGIYVGRDEMLKYMRGFLEPWDNLTVECLDTVEAGDTLLAEVEQSGEGIRSGAVTGFTYFQVWTFRGGKLMRLENVMKRDEALTLIGR